MSSSTQTTTEIPQSQSIFKAVPAVKNLVGFNVFNAVSFNIVMSTPMILLVQRWGASKLYTGSLMATMWLLSAMQLYMAPRVEYIGFRRLLLAGWTARTMILMVVCVLPFVSGHMSHTSLLWTTMICMTLYSFLRGVANTGYWPWIRTLISPQWRGRYFSLEQSVCNLSTALMLFFCGFVMIKRDLSDFQYGYLLVISCIAGWVSIFFLRKVDAPEPLPDRPKRIEPIFKWMPRVWAEKIFRHQMLTAICFYLTIGAFPLYTKLLLKENINLPEKTIYFIDGFNLAAIVLSAWFWGILADRFGSRPIMSLATRVLMALLVIWFFITLRIIPANPILLGVCFMLYGIGYNGFHISNQRLALNIAPKNFPVLGISTMQVFFSLSMGIGPIIWGGVLDMMKGVHWTVAGFPIDRYTIFYAISALMMISAKWMIRRLPNKDDVKPRQVLSYVIFDAPAQIFKK
ncbi:MFS transporter [bacterium]|nr:MFS transporter [bacterium]